MSVTPRGIVTRRDDEMVVKREAFAHPALFYRGLDDYLTGVGGFLQTGLAAGEPVFASVPPARLGPLRDYLGDQAGKAELFDMNELGRNPGRIMTALLDFAARRGSGRAWLVGEPIWASRSAAETREATRHEALINLAFADVPVTILCPYSLTDLSPGVLANAERTHPTLWSSGQEWASGVYTDPLVMDAECDAARDAPADAVRLPFGADDLAAVRQAAREFSQSSGLVADRGIDLVLAVGEAAANAIRHGGGRGTAVLWRTADAITVEIHDKGRLGDPLAGRRRPSPTATGGRGIWLIHQMCDLVEFAPGMIRMRMSL
jgi:anti-sigma regulatory factor (Ser/Thr protein kinase)